MITRFTAKNIVGVPNCDIVFPKSKMILIQGENGAGKTSLLKQITNPFRSLNNRVTELRTGENEGRIITELRFNNIDYRVEHIIQRNKKGYKNSSYLYKIIDGKEISLVDDGGAIKFKSAVEREFKLLPSHYAVLNIGVNNFGIVTMNNADRLVFMKNLLKLNYIDMILDIVKEKFKDAKDRSKFLTDQLKGINGDSYSIKIDNIKSDISRIQKDKVSKEGLLRELDRKSTNIEQLREKKIDTLEKLDQIEQLLAMLNSYKYNLSFDSLVDETLTKQTNLQIRINSLEQKVLDAIEKQNTLKSIESKDKIEEQIASIQKQIDADKAAILDPDNKDILDKLDSIHAYVKNITYIVQDYDNDIINIVVDALKYPQEFKANRLKYTKEYTDQVSMIDNIKLDKDKYTYQTNIVSLTPHPKTPLECPLRQEWQRQINNKDKYLELDSKQKQAEDYLTYIIKDKEDYEQAYQLLRVIYTMDKPPMLDRISGISTYEFINDLSVRDKVLSKIKQLYLDKKCYEHIDKLTIDLNLYQTRLKDISSISTLVEQPTNVDELNEQYNNAKIELANTTKAYNKMRTIHSIYSDMLPDKLLMEQEALNIVLDKTNEKINNVINEINLKTNLNTDIRKLNNELISLSGELSKLEYQYTEYTKKQSTLTNLESKKDIIENVRTIISSHLLLKLLKKDLRHIEDVVNKLLDGFMSVHFVIDEGSLDIICMREGIPRDASNLSSGESSMLSMALLMALKKYLPWDIVSIDEGSAMLDQENKHRFIYMLKDYANNIPSIAQMFIVSHDTIIEDGLDIFKIYIKDGKI